MANEGFGIIQVDPTVLVETAEDAYRKISAYREGLATIAGLVASSEGSWVGEAGEAYRAVFKTELAKVEMALDELSVYPGELLEYAGLYSEVITKAQEQVSSVSTFKML